MAIVLTDSANYSAIAAAIRAKNESETTYLPSEMAAAIEAIAPASTLGTKTVSANGTYSASSDNLDGYSSVTVAIPQYDGATSVTPGASATTLSTSGKVLASDITVAAIPITYALNSAGGNTCTIG